MLIQRNHYIMDGDLPLTVPATSYAKLLIVYTSNTLCLIVFWLSLELFLSELCSTMERANNDFKHVWNTNLVQPVVRAFPC